MKIRHITISHSSHNMGEYFGNVTVIIHNTLVGYDVFTVEFEIDHPWLPLLGGMLIY